MWRVVFLIVKILKIELSVCISRLIPVTYETMKVSATFLCSVAAWTLVVLMLINEYRSSTSVEPKADEGKFELVRPNKIVESKVVDIPSQAKAKTEVDQSVSRPVGRLEQKPKKIVEQKVESTKSAITASMPFEKHVPSYPNSKKILNAESYHVGRKSGISWKEFLSYPRSIPKSTLDITIPPSLKLNICSREVVGNVTAPGLSEKDFEWCKWTLSDTGGKVKVSSVV